MAEFTQPSSFTLSKPPLICVVARVRFTPITSIADYIPALQDKLRLIGFPHYEEGLARSFRISGEGEKGMNVTVDDQTQWSFSNLDRTISIQVDQESLSLVFGGYKDFATAKEVYHKVLMAAEEAIPALICVSFQLRYINHIPVVGDPSQWVNPSALGLPNIGDMGRLASVSETSFHTPEEGQLVVRCAVLPKGPSLPPDLLPLMITLKHDIQCESPFITLDCMHFKNTEAQAFQHQRCLKEISSLRSHLAEAFCNTVTPHALETWQ